MLKIALITNFNIPEKANAASTVAERLVGKDCRILVAAFNKEKLMRVGKHRDEFVYMPLEAVYSEADRTVGRFAGNDSGRGGVPARSPGRSKIKRRAIGASQTVKEHQFSKSENWCFSIGMKKVEENLWKNRSFAAPDC